MPRAFSEPARGRRRSDRPLAYITLVFELPKLQAVSVPSQGGEWTKRMTSARPESAARMTIAPGRAF
jgi:hypothetical protein